jgi:predicted metalloprotease with PDZ domain
MSNNSKRLCLALAIALGCSGLGATEITPAQRDQLRQELREAQKQLAEVGRRVAELSAEIGGDQAQVQMFRYLGNPDRAVIGVILGEGAGAGVRVEGVTPGGPAEKAGLKAGDTITAARGAAIGGNRPALALREALKDLKDGDKVSLSYVRDGKTFSTEVIATRQGSFELLAGPNARGFVFESDKGESIHFPPGMDSEIEAIVERHVGDGSEMRINMMAMSAMGGLRLTSLNPELGRYFGASDGALVLEVDSERYRGLQAGDIILEVDGKAVNDPRETMRELARQDPAKQVELKIQRDRIAQLVKISVPEKSRAFAPPAPPAPPSPPGAPAPPTPPAAPQPSWTPSAARAPTPAAAARPAVAPVIATRVVPPLVI